MRSPRFGPIAVCLTTLGVFALSAGCGESREEKLRRQIGYEKGDTHNPADDVKPIPPHPMREALRPLLEKMYSGKRLPDVLDAEGAVEGDYVMTAGVLAKIKLKPGLDNVATVRAIVHGTAEADAWIPREGARRTYGEQINKVKNSFKEEKDKVLNAYGDLKLLAVFNDEAIGGVIDSLPADVKGTVQAMQTEYVDGKDQIWERWMGVKMYARRAVAGDEPFKSLLKEIRKGVGVAEPEPLTWDNSHGPRFAAFGKEVVADEELFKMLTNLKELKDQVGFKTDTHALWVTEGSGQIPAKAKGTKIDKGLGFGVHREDLGGGFQEMTFIFPKKLSGAGLKYAYIRSHVYRHLFSDFQLLATAGNDFEGGIVPDKHDEAYAYCGSKAAADTMIKGFKDKISFLSNAPVREEAVDKIRDEAWECVIARASPDIKLVDPDNEMDVEGSAPGTRLGLFQMLARFESIDVNLDAMRKEVVKDQDELDAEAFLKANPNSQN